MVRGLALFGFTEDAIVIGPDGLTAVLPGERPVTGNVVAGNFIGPDANGGGLLEDPNPGVSPTGVSDVVRTVIGNAGAGVLLAAAREATSSAAHASRTATSSPATVWRAWSSRTSVPRTTGSRTT